jgi:4-diphosphocytidyl-2-C-methyl-D-erythritol kinase
VRLSTLAPAKVNLVLKVGPLRGDGYHELLSLMVPLDLADGVEVRILPRAGPVRCRVIGRPELCGPENLGARAAAAFKERFGVRSGIAVRIEKRIPVTAGLGGGSSDAAAVLRCLARAFGIEDKAALTEVALSIGSDVPFFLGPGPAWARGRGERLLPVDLPSLPLVLVYPKDPSLAIRAGEAYRWLDELRQGRTLKRRLVRPRSFSVSRAGNDLEEACLVRRPAISPLLWLLQGVGAERAMMSGSGPTVFGVFSGMGAARRAALTIQGRGGGLRASVFVVRTMRGQPRVTPWRSPRSASFRSTKRS